MQGNNRILSILACYSKLSNASWMPAAKHTIKADKTMMYRDRVVWIGLHSVQHTEF